MILFGGVGLQGRDLVTLPSTHILDVVTMAGIKGPDVPAMDQRFHAANDQFIA
jgi:hypothetical protein